MSQRSKRNNKRNGKSKKQPKVGRWATKDHRNKYQKERKGPGWWAHTM